MCLSANLRCSVARLLYGLGLEFKFEVDVVSQRRKRGNANLLSINPTYGLQSKLGWSDPYLYHARGSQLKPSFR